jgi:NADPH-dependent curcumin reductase CurA
MTSTNRQWRLASYPSGMPTLDNWVLSETAVPQPGQGEMLVRSLYLDLAPYMRARINPQKNYAGGVAPGDVMVGGAIGEVMQSNCAGFAVRDMVVTDFGFGWQDYAVLKTADVRRVDASVAPLPYWLDAFGLNGLTAYFSLFETARMKAGDTVLVSAASGSVGQVAGQLAKLAGCRAVAVTSSEDKAAWCRELGYDAVVNYRSAPDLAAAIAQACPKGVDVFIDNTAGPIHDAALQNLALHARVVIVGTVSQAATFGQPDMGPRYLRNILVARASVQGFLCMDHVLHYEAARARMLAWYAEGKLQSRFDVMQGLEHTPAAFLRVLNSQNLGKQLVQVR